MTMSAPNHPITQLVVFIDSDFDDADAHALRDVATALSDHDIDWVRGPPRFVDESDDDGVRTVGLVHEIHAPRDRDDRLLDAATDRRELTEVRTLVDELAKLSAIHQIDLGLELDGDSVGWIEAGQMTTSLRDGLLASWAARHRDT